MPQESWSLLGSRYVREYKILRVREDRYRFKPTGAEADFVICDSADWVVIVPITKDGDIVFVRQFRHGVRQVVLETPGGIMDPGEDPAETAARELLEETGFEAATWEMPGALFPNPALNNARCHVAVARECSKTSEPSLDPFERIDVELRPQSQLKKMIQSGELCHAQAIAAFCLAGMME